jgi:hypothetical protein
MAGRGGIGSIVLVAHLYFAAAFFGWMLDTRTEEEPPISFEQFMLMLIAVAISIASPVALALLTRPKLRSASVG